MSEMPLIHKDGLPHHFEVDEQGLHQCLPDCASCAAFNATVCVRLDGLADRIAAVVHDATCDFGNPCTAGPGDKDDARASAVIALLLSLAVQ